MSPNPMRFNAASVFIHPLLQPGGRNPEGLHTGAAAFPFGEATPFTLAHLTWVNRQNLILKTFYWRTAPYLKFGFPHSRHKHRSLFRGEERVCRPLTSRR